MKLNKMNLKKTKKEYNKLFSIDLDFEQYKSKSGIIFTIYYEKLNLLEVGFFENNKLLGDKLKQKDSILLDKKGGKINDLNLLIGTLNELGIKSSGQLHYKYSNTLMRHLSTLGWPIGQSLHKARRIRKELTCALI